MQRVQKAVSFFITYTLFFYWSKTIKFIDQLFIKDENASAINKNADKDIKEEEWNISQWQNGFQEHDQAVHYPSQKEGTDYLTK